MSRSRDPFKNGFGRHLDEAYQAALEEAARNGDENSPAHEEEGGKDIALGAVRLRVGVGEKHERWIGRARIEVTYRGPREEAGGVQRPMYRVVIHVDRLHHKLTVGGAANWYEEHGVPSSPAAIDAAAGGAVRFASEPDEDTPEDIAETINEATMPALKEDGSYEVRRTK